MRVTFATPIVAAAALGAIAWAAYDLEAAWLTFALCAPAGVASVLATKLLVAHRARLGGLRRQGLAIAALIAAQAAAIVGVFVWRMFLSPHDAFFAAVLSIYALVVGALCASLLGRGALADLEAVRRTLHAVAEGRRDVASGVRGGGEIAELSIEPIFDLPRRDKLTIAPGHGRGINAKNH